MTTKSAQPKKAIVDNVLGAIGHTPISKLNKIGQDCGANLFVKLEFMNPGGSIKDRIGYWMIEDAEKKGLLKPGGTIVEGTSGNTGVGLAIAAAIKGYKCIFVLPDKMSQEKILNLRAFGAKVVVTPTAVEFEDPRSYYQVSRRLHRETPNSIYVNQYDNLSNSECHYKTTGPEILEQMPQIDAFIAGIGTGGTICGTGKYLREKKPEVQIVAVDPIGSIVYDVFKHGKPLKPAAGYKIEGIGEDFIPKNYDLSLVNEIVQVEDKESFLMARDLLLKEGLFCGISSGSAVVGALKWIKAQGSKIKGKNVLIILPDSGNRYLTKLFNDDWMREAGFLEKPSMGTVGDILGERRHTEILTAKPTDKISSVVQTMREKDISQLPVVDDKDWIKGVITESAILKAIFEGRVGMHDAIDILIDSAIDYVSPSDPLEKASKILTSGKTPLVTDPMKGNKLVGIITKIDILGHMGK